MGAGVREHHAAADAAIAAATRHMARRRPVVRRISGHHRDRCDDDGATRPGSGHEFPLTVPAGRRYAHRRRIRRVRLLVLVLLLASVSLAADRPVAGDRLTLKDPVGRPERRSVRFKAARDTAVDPLAGADPRVLGATLEIAGANAGDGNTGPITLAAGFWAGLGNPAGSKGYRFKDPLRTTGVKVVTLKSGGGGGTLAISGGQSNWPYAITQAQGPIDLRLTLGTDVYCARFTTFDHNEPGRVRAKLAPAPPDCGGTLPTACGNGVAEGTEECDDGGTTGGDGCSATCQLEDTSALCAGVPTVSGTGLDAVLVQSGLTRPLLVTAPPLDPNRIFIVEQGGLVRIVKNGVPVATPFIDVSADSLCCGEQGLLGMAFAPDYETSGVFYLSYTNNAGKPEVRRYAVSSDPDVANTSSTLVIQVEDFASNHNGGHIAFGPDGYLYYGMGDGGGSGDPQETAQDLNRLLGKLLRIDVNAPTYAIPPTNPFVGAPGLDEIWAYGLRNPWRWSHDRGTGDLYIADVGQNTIEEVNVEAAASTGGENYGWDVFEGDACFEPTPPDTMCPNPPTGFTFPVLTYTHALGCSVTGGYVYRGCRMPDLHGTYFYSDICSGFVKTFKGVAGGVAQNQQDRTADVAPGGGLSIGGVSSFGEDARGELYVVDYGGGLGGQGEVYRLVPGS
jgi:cysteine-rich repeat protein